MNANNLQAKAYVWYVAYGSNLLVKRFLLYITGGKNVELNIEQIGCLDKTMPLQEKPWEIPYQLYFSQVAQKWGGGGVAFLDDTVKGETLGKAYLITRDQFEAVKKQEGTWYAKTISLGHDQGFEVVTISSVKRLPSNPPAKAYIDVVRAGLYETYPTIDKSALDNYLETCVKR